MGNHSIWRLAEEDTDIAVGILSRGFIDDPQFSYALPDLAQREAMLPIICAASVRSCFRHGTVWAGGPSPGRTAGVALSFPMPEGQFTADELKEFGFDVADPVNEAILTRMSATEDAANELLDACFPGPHRHLLQLAVDTAHRRRGLGRALVSAVIEEAIETGRPVSLATLTPSNVSFYRGLGFTELGHGIAAGDTSWWVFGTTQPSAPDQ